MVLGVSQLSMMQTEIQTLESEIKTDKDKVNDLRTNNPYESFISGYTAEQRPIYHGDLGQPCYSARCTDPLKIVGYKTVQIPHTGTRIKQGVQSELDIIEPRIKQKEDDLKKKRNIMNQKNRGMMIW